MVVIIKTDKGLSSGSYGQRHLPNCPLQDSPQRKKQGGREGRQRTGKKLNENTDSASVTTGRGIKQLRSPTVSLCFRYLNST